MNSDIANDFASRFSSVYCSASGKIAGKEQNYLLFLKLLGMVLVQITCAL